MRSSIALSAALAVGGAAACGHDAHVVRPTAAGAASAAPEAATTTASAAQSSPRGDSDAGLGSASASSSAPASPGAAPTAPAPIDAHLPAPDTLRLSNKASCPAKICRLEGSLLEALVGSSESRAPAGIWEEDLGPGAIVSFARRADMDVLGVVLAGTIALAADEAKGRTTELMPWHAFVAPGSGIALRAHGGPARIALVVVTVGEAPAGKLAAAKPSAWTARPAPVASIDLAAAPDLAWGKGAYHARIAFAADASPRASLGILRMSADGAVAPHVHDNEWEHMAILQGEGDFIQGEGEAERTLHASDGVTFSVPPGTRHQWRSAGSRAFVGIQVYTPPGPEQRFKKLAAPP
jgi:mannose-6-phosphate isomerase-like protein (cupin superfamily)